MMDELSAKYFTDLRSADADVRYEAFRYLMKETQNPVDWANEVWDNTVALTRSASLHERTIGAQLLINLSKSDPDRKIVDQLDWLMAITGETKWVSVRPVLQSVWKVGILDKELQDLVCERLVKRFEESTGEQNESQVRIDIMEGFRKLFDQFRDETVKAIAHGLITTEANPRLQAKLLGLWKRS